MVYTLVSGTSERKLVEVQVLSSAPKNKTQACLGLILWHRGLEPPAVSKANGEVRGASRAHELARSTVQRKSDGLPGNPQSDSPLIRTNLKDRHMPVF